MKQAVDQRHGRKMSYYRTCLVPMCRNSGSVLVNWRKHLATNPDFPCPRHKEPTSQCKCTQPFEIHRFPMVNTAQRRLWVDLLQRPRHFDPNYWHGVCSAHFVNGAPSAKYPFPILYLGLERWQLDETLKTWFTKEDIEQYAKFADMAAKEASQESSFTAPRIGRPFKTVGPRTSGSTKNDRPRYHPYQPGASQFTPSPSSASTMSVSGRLNDATATASTSASLDVASSSSSTSSTNSAIRSPALAVRKGCRDTAVPVSLESNDHTSTSIRRDRTKAAPVVQEVGREVEVGSSGMTLAYAHLQASRGDSVGFQEKSFIDQHTYASLPSTSAAAVPPPRQHSVRTMELPCSNEQCRRTKCLAETYRKGIADLDARIDAQKREQQRLAVRLRDGQLVLSEREEQNQKCVQCQRISQLYHQSSVACKQMEQRLMQLAMDRFNCGRQLYRLYGEKRARLMIKLLKVPGAKSIAVSAVSDEPAPAAAAVLVKVDPEEETATCDHEDGQ